VCVCARVRACVHLCVHVFVCGVFECLSVYTSACMHACAHAHKCMINLNVCAFGALPCLLKICSLSLGLIIMQSYVYGCASQHTLSVVHVWSFVSRRM